jgi:hypothetical protein
VHRVTDKAKAVSRTLNEELETKATFHNGTYSTLNIYFLSNWNPERFRRFTYGFCSFPLAAPGLREVAIDGCIVQQSAMPGSFRPEADRGFTAVHEVGHWLGLHHPWGDNENNPGCLLDDWVLDTPRQSRPSSGCPRFQKTCPGLGQDNYHNYMDYSDDSCLTTFTRGQIRRMNRRWSRRAGK